MQVFEAKKSYVPSYIMIGIIVIVSILFPAFVKDLMDKPIMFLPILGPFGIFAWIYKSTIYEIKNSSTLYYKSGPMKGEIEINRIKKIEQNVRHYVGRKPALASNGLLISYNRFSKIYMAPADAEGFIAAIKRINPDVEVV